MPGKYRRLSMYTVNLTYGIFFLYISNCLSLELSRRMWHARKKGFHFCGSAAFHSSGDAGTELWCVPGNIAWWIERTVTSHEVCEETLLEYSVITLTLEHTADDGSRHTGKHGYYHPGNKTSLKQDHVLTILKLSPIFSVSKSIRNAHQH